VFVKILYFMHLGQWWRGRWWIVPIPIAGVHFAYRPTQLNRTSSARYQAMSYTLVLIKLHKPANWTGKSAHAGCTTSRIFDI